MSFSSFTGDHAEINVVTRTKREERQKMFSSLPQKTQELLIPKPTFFDGCSSDAEEWMQSTKDFVSFNQMELSFAFDMLLRNDAKQLWQEFCSTKQSLTNEETEQWFNDSFTTTKSIVEKIAELYVCKQKPNERYRNYEIRVKQLVKEVFDSKLSVGDISRMFILKGTRNDKLKEAFILDPDMSDDRRRDLASNLEKNQIVEDVKPIKPSYSDIVSRNNKINYFSPENTPRFHKPISMESKKHIHERRDYEYRQNKPVYENDRRQIADRMNHNEMPKHSMKFIATTLYNRCKGKSPPKEEILKPGDCFCCGGADHRRIDCPLRNKCLICGKEGHLFKNCFIIQNRQTRVPARILCVQEEQQEYITDIHDEINHDVEDYEDEKNAFQPPVSISSVGLGQ